LDYEQLFYSIAPPLFALILTLLPTGQEQYCRKHAESICADLELQNIYKRAYGSQTSAEYVIRCVELITHFAVSTVTISNYVASILSFLFSIIFAFRSWPDKFAYWGVLSLVVLFILIFRPWILGFSSIPFKELSSMQVPGKHGPKSYTYAELFRWQQIGFNITLIIVIVAGSYFFSLSPKDGTASAKPGASSGQTGSNPPKQ
jgi:hypothetical protein